MKRLDRTARAYCGAVRKKLPIRGPRRTAFLKSLRQDADEYLRTHPWATSEELADRFGAPEDIAVTFVSEMSYDEINERFRAGNRVIRIALIVAGAALALLALGIFWMILRNSLDMTGYMVVTG